MLWQGDGWGPVPGWQPGSLLQKPRPGVTPAKISRLCAVPIAGSSCCSDPPWPPPKSSPEGNRWEKSLGSQKMIRHPFPALAGAGVGLAGAQGCWSPRAAEGKRGAVAVPETRGTAERLARSFLHRAGRDPGQEKFLQSYTRGAKR